MIQLTPKESSVSVNIIKSPIKHVRPEQCGLILYLVQREPNKIQSPLD